jgi:hypothetical protein
MEEAFDNMRIWVFAICRNEADIIPFWLRNYQQFADKLIVYDDRSDDGSRDLLQAHHLMELHDWHTNTGIDEDEFLRFAHATYRTASGLADWVMWVDMDEFLFHPEMRDLLWNAMVAGFDVIQTKGFNMTGSGLPENDGRQIWEILTDGVPSPVYSKPVVFRPQVHLRWNRGKHALEDCDGRVTRDAPIYLLHYRYLGSTYTAAKNRRNYARCGLKTGDKNPAWTCAPTWKGEHSPIKSERMVIAT